VSEACRLLIPKASSNEYLYLCKRLHYQDTKEGTAQTQLQDEIIKHRANVSHFIEKQLIHQEEVHYEDMGLADLLLISNPEVKDTQKILQSYGFNNPELAYQTLKEMLAQSNNKHLLLSILLISSHLWPRSPDPDKVLIHLEDFFNQVDQDLIQNIFFNPNITQLLISIFGHSEHLSQLLCQHPDWIEFLFDLLDHDQIKSQTTLKHSFKKRLSSKDSFMTCIEKLVIYHKQELLCIGLRDIYKQVNLEQTIQEISELTDLIIDQVFVLILTNKNYLHLYKKQCIIAMGKLGGEELNYSSDIDLLFLLDNDLTEKDREQISAVNLDLIKILTEPRSLGSFFRVDMRLRPYGQSGPLQIPSSAYLKYYETEAQGWELQAWIKARSISGNITLGEGVIHQVQSICLEAKRQKNIFQNTDKLQKQQCLILERKNIIDKEVKEGKYGINDHDYLLKGDVFTEDVIQTWIEYKLENEVKACELQPTPMEFELYYNI
jgi:glutamate-ammonia-ligase adenylyltransferase